MSELLAVVLGSVFLHMFFRAVESRWPASYFALTSGPDYAISRNVVRYVAFRLLPVLVVCAFAAVSLDRSGGKVALPVLAIGVVHAAATSGRALVWLIRSGGWRTRPLHVMLHPFVALLVCLTAALAAVAADRFDALVPDVDQLSSDLWTGLVAGVVGAYAVRVTGSTMLDEAMVFRESRASISTELWGQVPILAATADASPDLVKAAMLVENLQRPKWFRNGERLAARLLRRQATLGLLQSRSDPRSTETELLSLGIQERFAGVRIEDDAGRIDYPLVEQFGLSYGGDRRYSELLIAALGHVRSWRLSEEADNS